MNILSSSVDPRGLFAPNTVTWRIHSDPAMAVGGIRALLQQALHPDAVVCMTRPAGLMITKICLAVAAGMNATVPTWFHACGCGALNMMWTHNPCLRKAGTSSTQRHMLMKPPHHAAC
jgi:hypothetical protein